MSPASGAFLVLRLTGLLKDKDEDPLDPFGIQPDQVGFRSDDRQEFLLTLGYPARASRAAP